MNFFEFIDKLQAFVDDTIGDNSRAAVFLTGNTDGSVSLNMLIGADFDEVNSAVSQVNITIAPADSELFAMVSENSQETSSDLNLNNNNESKTEI